MPRPPGLFAIVFFLLMTPLARRAERAEHPAALKLGSAGI